MLEGVVSGYLLMLILSGLGWPIFSIIYRWRTHQPLRPVYKLFMRSFLHFVIGVTLFFLLISKLIGAVGALAIASILLIGMEYAMAIVARQSSTRREQ